MVGRQFWSKVQLKLFRKHQLLYFLLLGIALFSFTVAWANSDNSLINLSDSNVGVNYSLTHTDALLSVANEAD
ncbi:MAG: hypothetical protein AB1589_06805, partial [Cyanobacteriota bacterium]